MTTVTPGAEPVAYLYTRDDGSKDLLLSCNGEYARNLLEAGATETPLYATPQAQTAVVEAWLPIEGWAGRYEVSKDGQVRRTDGVLIKQWKNTHGYPTVRLSSPRSLARVHRLVATAYIPNPKNKPFVNHINNDRADNRVENLEWCTQKENLDHAAKQGRMQRNYWSGKRSPGAKLSDVTVHDIRAEYAAGGISWERLGEKYGVSKRSIGRIIKGESYAEVR